MLRSWINDRSYIFSILHFQRKKSSPLYYLMTKFFFFLFIVLILQYDYVFCIILLQFILFFRAIYFSCKINFVSSTFSFYHKYLNIFKRVGDLCVNCFFWFSQSFFFTAFLSMNIEIVPMGNRTKTCVFNISQNLSKHKSFDVIIIKYTLSVLFAFTVQDFWAFTF